VSRRAPGKGLKLVEVPSRAVTGTVQVIVLLVDFSDNVGHRPLHEFDDMLFSRKKFQTGSLRDFYAEVTLGKVDVTGSVHGSSCYRNPITSVRVPSNGGASSPVRRARCAPLACRNRQAVLPRDQRNSHARVEARDIAHLAVVVGARVLVVEIRLVVLEAA
jgi:hypothetical protein